MNGRQLAGRLARLGLSWPIRARLVKAARIASAPRMWGARRRGIAMLGTPAPGSVQKLQAHGHAPLDMVPAETVAATIEACRALHRRATSASDAADGFNNRNLLEIADFDDYPAILDLVRQPTLLATIAAYLDTVPVVGSVQVWWSTPNERTEGSQLFHRDKADFRQVKLFLNVLDVDVDNGPFSFIPADRTSQIGPSLRDPFDRVEDDEIETASAADHVDRLTGIAGTGRLVDTCRCLHQGSRTRKGERLVLMVQYLTYHCIAEPKDKVWSQFLDVRAGRAADGDPVLVRL